MNENPIEELKAQMQTMENAILLAGEALSLARQALYFSGPQREVDAMKRAAKEKIDALIGKE